VGRILRPILVVHSNIEAGRKELALVPRLTGLFQDHATATRDVIPDGCCLAGQAPIIVLCGIADIEDVKLVKVSLADDARIGDAGHGGAEGGEARGFSAWAIVQNVKGNRFFPALPQSRPVPTLEISQVAFCIYLSGWRSGNGWPTSRAAAREPHPYSLLIPITCLVIIEEYLRGNIIHNCICHEIFV
jgi:hypothetical protein